MKNKNLQQEIDLLTTEAELAEVIEYAKERIKSIKPTLHEVLDSYFTQYPEARYCILGGFGSGCYECTGHYYVMDDNYFELIQRLSADELKNYPKNEILNCLMFGDEDVEKLKTSEWEKLQNEIERFDDNLRQAKDFPKITEEEAYRQLQDRPGCETIFIYDYKYNRVVSVSHYNW